MASSTTSLVYAVSVGASDIIAASRVFTRVGPTLHGLDELQRALKQRTIVRAWLGARVPAIKRVPVEVWELTKQELIDLEVRAERVELMELFTCSVCAEIAVMEDLHEVIDELDQTKSLNQLKDQLRTERKDYRASGQRMFAWSRVWIDLGDERHLEEPGCDNDTIIRDKWHTFATSQIKHSDSIEKLLAEFGLYLPSKEVIHPTHGERDRSESVLVVAADLSKVENLPAPSPFTHDFQRHSPSHTSLALTKLSPDFSTALALEIDTRFKRLSSTWSISTRCIPSAAPPITAAAAVPGAQVPAPVVVQVQVQVPPAVAAATAAVPPAVATSSDDSSGSGSESEDEDNKENEAARKPGWMILNEISRR